MKHGRFFASRILARGINSTDYGLGTLPLESVCVVLFFCKRGMVVDERIKCMESDGTSLLPGVPFQQGHEELL